MEQSRATGEFHDRYRGRRVLVTGHTGFKGSWLALWLRNLGAEVCGLALDPPSTPAHFEVSGLRVRDIRNDIRDGDSVEAVFREFAPDIVFHLAAQSLVRRGYREPVATFETNVLGTVNVLDASRRCSATRAVLVVTSDKCYENREWVWGYRETDALGGHDPYSASKGCAEIVAASYRRAFEKGEGDGASQTLIASCRAGNVIGGGDWAEDRLVPDLVRAAAAGSPALIRNPGATRPWQHVLEPLSGYLELGEKLLDGQGAFAESWNFGPGEEDHMSVRDVAALFQNHWGRVDCIMGDETEGPHEARLLRLDCSKARFHLSWRPVWGAREAVGRTADWYRQFYEHETVCSGQDLFHYVDAARAAGLAWAAVGN